MRVARECGAEADLGGQAHQPHLAQRDAADRLVALDGVQGVDADFGGIEREQIVQALVKKRQRAIWFAAGGNEQVVQVGWQTGVQATTAVRCDVDAITLQAFGARTVALEDRDADAGLFEPLREPEAAQAGANDEHVHDLSAPS